MNPTLKTVITIIITGVVAIGAWLIISSIQENNEINAKSEQFRTSFMSGCVPEANTSYCACVYDDITDSVGVRGIYDMAVQYDKTGTVPDSAFGSVYRCMDKI